jgi:hypothetical protein
MLVNISILLTPYKRIAIAIHAIKRLAIILNKL